MFPTSPVAVPSAEECGEDMEEDKYPDSQEMDTQESESLEWGIVIA